MKQEELQNRIDDALELDDLLSLPRGFHVAENVFGQEMYIWRETVGEGYSVNDTLRMYKNDDIRMYNFNCITDTIVEVITTCNTYTLLTVHLL